MVEDWRHGIGPQWVSFGSPRPYVTASSGRTVLVPNGDSTWENGVFLRDRVATSEGVGAEFSISAPLTLPEWQEIYLVLLSTDSLDTAGWDLDEGRLPIPDAQWRECVVHYPATETRAGHGQLSFLAGITRTVPAPAAMPREPGHGFGFRPFRTGAAGWP